MAKQNDQAKGCGCLLLLALLPVSMVYSCVNPDDEEKTPLASSVVATSTTRSAPTFIPLAPVPSTTAAATTTTRRPSATSSPQGTPKPKPKPDPERDDSPAPRRTASNDDDSGGSAYYANCDAVRAAGKAPIHRGDPGYRAGLDRDGDGQGCGPD